MIDHLRTLIASQAGFLPRQNLCREYLQARLLESLQREGAFRAWAFCGGTCLRFLFGLPRFSEDLDFSLAEADPGLPFREVMEGVRRRLAAEGYAVEAKVNDQRKVHAAMVSFRGLPKQLGLSPDPRIALSIKIELDTRPPPGAVLATTLIRRHVVVHLSHHDRASLLAGKLHAILSRPWLKGRDLYDLAWYLADRTWPPPNLPFLRAALQQTSWPGQLPTATTWKRLLVAHLTKADWARARADIEPFLERPADLTWITPEVLLPLLGKPGATSR